MQPSKYTPATLVDERKQTMDRGFALKEENFDRSR